MFDTLHIIAFNFDLSSLNRGQQWAKWRNIEGVYSFSNHFEFQPCG